MKKKIIYIAGYSRSGSTILDILLSSQKDIFGTGELVYLFTDWMDETRKCTCNNTYDNCPFWCDYKLPDSLTYEQANTVLRDVESRKNLQKLLDGKLIKQEIKTYSSIQNSLFNYIAEKSGKNIIVDSSKSSRDMAGRFYALHKYTDFDVYVIHLVKNGLNIVESYVTKGRNWALEGYGKNDKFLAQRSSLGWFFANKIALDLGLKMPANRYLKVKYEDLVLQPETTLQQIGNFIETDLSTVIKNIQLNKSFAAKHNVGGNRLRLEKEIKFQQSNKLKKINISFINKVFFKLVAGKLSRQLGYKNN